MITPIVLISVIILIINLVLGFFVFFKNRQNLVNKIFFGITLGIVFWISGLLLITEKFLAAIPLLPLFGLRTAFAAASLLPLLFLRLSVEFPSKKEDLSKLLQIIFLAITFFAFSASLFSDLIVVKIKDIQGWKYIAQYGSFYPIFGLYFVAFMTIGIVTLWRKMGQYKDIENIQIRYLLAGSVLSLVFATTTNLILPMATGISAFAKFGPLGTIFLVAFTFYAIIKHHLMNIRVIATEIFVAAIVLLFLINTILARSLTQFFIEAFLLILSVFFGLLLIKGTLREIETIRQLSQAKSEFISIVSHQLRTPLTAMKGYASLLLEGTYGKFDARARSPVENIYKSNERLINLVNDLLNLSRIEAGKMEMDFQKTQIEDIISSVVGELEMEARKKNIDLIWSASPEPLPQVLADRDKMRHIILNLVDNGIRYTDKGSVTIRLKWQMTNDRIRDKIIIEIQDTGDGMTPEELSRLFESFSRGNAGTKLWTEGTGLGLYIVKKFIEMNHGRVWAESPGRGKGSTFFVELPVLGN